MGRALEGQPSRAGVSYAGVTPDERWLAAVWPFVPASLPPAPARVLEIGCGTLGGFVPRLRDAGYEAIGVDPEAPAGPWFLQSEFGADSAPAPAAAIVACTSLHHVADLPGTVASMEAALLPGGTVVVIEWARERFGEATARWCQARLSMDSGESWLDQLLSDWQESGSPWADCCRAWAEAEQIHAGREVLDELGARFDTVHLSYGPYFFPDLDGIMEADEQAAIDEDQIAATRIQYHGRKR
jgi:SAM-dependent methyltransferase